MSDNHNWSNILIYAKAGPVLFLFLKNAKVGPVLREVVASHPEEVAAAEEVRT